MPEPGRKPQTCRCRLYRIMKDFLAGKDLIAEFWDFTENPREPQDLPVGTELVGTFTDFSANVIREQIADFRGQHGNFFHGDWSYRGSI